MALSYSRREDGMISVVIDSNAWNYLFEKGIDLFSELPPDKFLLFIPREIEIEIEAIPNNESKRELIAYIRQSVADCDVKTTHVFGFFTQNTKVQIYGGFGFGTFQSATELEFYDLIRDQYIIGKACRNSGLGTNVADAAVAAKSFYSIVLTNENPNKSGPLRVAFDRGGNVLYLTKLDNSNLFLKDFIIQFHNSP